MCHSAYRSDVSAGNQDGNDPGTPQLYSCRDLQAGSTAPRLATSIFASGDKENWTITYCSATRSDSELGREPPFRLPYITPSRLFIQQYKT